MNKLILIGNGFDLAHGLKTKYSDFILWYLSKIKKNERGYEDKLIEVRILSRLNINDYKSISEYKEDVKVKRIEVKFKLPIYYFFEAILNDLKESNWVDIESIYYKFLINIFKRHEKLINDKDSIDVLDLKENLTNLINKIKEWNQIN